MSASKYIALGEFLFNTIKDQVTLSFSDIEEILGFPLPKSARKFRTWWANDSTHSHAKNGWLSMGWSVADIDMETQLAQFKRAAKLRLHKSVPSRSTPETAELPTIERVRRFEVLAREIFSKYFGKRLRPGLIPNISKLFDFVSKDKKIVGDSKYLSLKGKRIQPTKIAAISEDVWLLEKSKAERKFLVFGNARAIPEGWLSRYGNLVENIEFYFLDEQERLHRLPSDFPEVNK